MQRLGPFLLIALGCTDGTQLLDYDTYVPVIVQVEGPAVPQTVLFSAPHGEILEVVEVVPPATLEREVPPGSAVSARFTGGEAMMYVVSSIDDLQEGDEVTLAPMLWNLGGEAAVELDVPGITPYGLHVEASGHGFGAIQSSTRIYLDPAEDPVHLGLALTDDTGAVVGVYALTVPFPTHGRIAVPPVAAFDQQLVDHTLTVAGRGSERVTVGLWGVVDDQNLSLGTVGPRDLEPVDASGTTVRSLYPFDYDGFLVHVVAVDGETRTIRNEARATLDAPIQLDTTLPDIVAAQTTPDSVDWTLAGPLDAADVLHVRYGSSTGLGTNTEPSEWWIVRRPTAEGAWTMPELPPRLAHWAMDPESSVAHVGVFDLNGTDWRSALPHLYRRPTLGERPRVSRNRRAAPR